MLILKKKRNKISYVERHLEIYVFVLKKSAKIKHEEDIFQRK